MLDSDASKSEAEPSGQPATEGTSVVDGYDLVRRVGVDSYGDIHVGQRGDDRCVITFLNERLVVDVVAARRFADEISRANSLTAQGVIRTLSFDFQVRPRWISSDFVSGQLLRQRVESIGPLQQPAARLLANQLARSLQALHAHGLIQRDLSPDSVLLGPEGAYLWHTGWAGLVDGSDYAGTTHTRHPEWLAPEQVLGEATSPASDVHAWAVTILYAATGHNPFAADGAALTVSRLMKDTPLIPPLFDPVLASLIAGALSKDPAARPTTRELLVYLDPAAPLLQGVPANAVEAPVISLTKSNEYSSPANGGEGQLPLGGIDPQEAPLGAKPLQQDHDDVDDSTDAYYLDDEDEPGAADGAQNGIRLSLLALLSALVVAVGCVIGILIGRVVGG